MLEVLGQTPNIVGRIILGNCIDSYLLACVLHFSSNMYLKTDANHVF